ncbi:Sodium/potassium-transporting ATPase subunit beta-1 [Taenia crassiceps]|uniref:Sodium/potassium-transporting ATPase subunit beta-1 n=1 Tax=Taenia crassiceps TaxID=6207 RepID=A0ABR4Q096_9CEST
MRPLLLHFLDSRILTMKKFGEIRATLTQRLRRLGLFILNTEKGTFLKRTPSSWGRQSLLNLRPGLTFLPVADAKGNLLPYPVFDSDHRDNYVEFMRKYLSDYATRASDCDFIRGVRDPKKVQNSCRFPIWLLGPCSQLLFSGQHFCIFLKMNKIYGYLPDVFSRRIFVSCQATDESKRDELGPVNFFPSPPNNRSVGYFSTVAFPYLNQPDYQSPLLAVVFPSIKGNVSITVSCRYLNIDVDEVYKFELVVRDTQSPLPLGPFPNPE